MEPFIPVDLPLKAKWEAALRRLKSAKDWHARYTAAAEIVRHQPPLYLAGRIATCSVFIERELKESRASAYRNMHVAALATARQVERYTATRLELAIAFVEAKAGRTLEHRGDLDFDRLRITVERAGVAISAPLHDVSHRELRALLAALKVKRRGADALVAVLRRAGLEHLEVTVRNDQLVLKTPLEGLASVARALTTTLIS